MRIRQLPVLILAFATSFCASAAQTLVIRASGYVAPSGELRKGAAITVQDGVITRVATGGAADEEARGSKGDKRGSGKSAASESETVIDFGVAVVCPGLIDVQSALGAMGNLHESKSAIQLNAAAAEVFDEYHIQLASALQAGVTAFSLTPDDSDLVGGVAAVCKTSGRDERPYVLTADGPVKLSLSPEMMQRDREPTSRADALAMFRTLIDNSRSSKSESALAAFAAGKTTAIVAAPSGSDVLAMLQVGAPRGLKFAFVHSRDARSIAGEVAAAKCPVIVGPFGWSESPRTATAAAVFDKAGATVAIAGGLPNAPADALRVSAAIAARNGLPLNAARRSITSVPAAVLGVADRLGSIEQGRHADLVVFSGDPLDLRSRVLAVFVDGKKVVDRRAE